MSIYDKLHGEVGGGLGHGKKQHLHDDTISIILLFIPTPIRGKVDTIPPSPPPTPEKSFFT